jgi:mannitol/fructose-specific phosphotransferase system IIA component
LIIVKSKLKKKKKPILDIETKSIFIREVENPEKALKIITSFLNKEGITDESFIHVMITNPINKNVKVKFD